MVADFLINSKRLSIEGGAVEIGPVQYSSWAAGWWPGRHTWSVSLRNRGGLRNVRTAKARMFVAQRKSVWILNLKKC